MHKAHVTLGEDGVLLFDYPAKHGKQRGAVGRSTRRSTRSSRS
jgi:hypothetical protein